MASLLPTDLSNDPVAHGQHWMKKNAGRMHAVSGATAEQPSIELYDNYVQILIFEATGDRSLVTIKEPDNPSGKWNFFQGPGQLTTPNYPNDLDTTSLALTVFGCDEKHAHDIMDDTLNYLTPEGISPVYYDYGRVRIDAGVATNTLALFYAWERGKDLAQTFQWVHDILRDRTYVANGTKYYEADFFLWLLTRLLRLSNDHELHATIGSLLKERIQERFGLEGDALALAQRIIVADFFGIRDEVDFRALLPLQKEDGGWGVGWMYRFGMGIRIGNEGLTTALAVKAIELMRASEPPISM